MNETRKAISHITIRCILVILTMPAYVLLHAQPKFQKTAAEMAGLKKLVNDVEVNPENQAAHKAFINALNLKDPFLEAQYKTWIARFPKSSTVPFAIGEALASRSDPRAKEYLLKVVAIKPDHAKAWEHLSFDARFRGDTLNSLGYMEKAKNADPKNPDYAFYYANHFETADPNKFDSLLLALAWRFPESERGAMAIHWLARNANNENEKIAYYEQLYRKYRDKGSMSAYFDFLINSDPIKAYNLALEMVLEVKRNRHYWTHKLKVAKTFIAARRLLTENKPFEAIELLNKVDLGNRVHGDLIDASESLLLLKAEAADAADQINAAYDTIAAYYKNKPSPMLREFLLKYAAKLGKDEKDVDQDIWNRRISEAAVATDFSLESYLSQKTVSLSDFQGKVVLITYWFPSCSPCRREFPYFESVIKKFSEEDVAYLGINISQSEDEFVLPYLQSSGVSFIPLREDPNRTQGNLKASHAPVNYIIDQKGRILFSDFYIDKKNKEEIELMIHELLKVEKDSI